MAKQTKYTVLIVEDDKFFVKAFKDKLKREGFNVAIALNGKEAMLRLKEEKPDIVLLDLIMPVKDGFEVLEEMKLSDDLKDIPVIILSVLEQSKDVKKGLELGAVDYLVKGDFSISAVVKKIKEHLTKTRIKK